MSSTDPSSMQVFTIEQANEMLPLVRVITRDIVQLSNSMIERRERLNHLKNGREQLGGDVYSDELADVERMLEEDSSTLKGYVDELDGLGVHLKSLPDGLVDFPSLLDDRMVYLCWKYDEPEIEFWHEWDKGFAGRQPIHVAVGDDADFGDGA